MRSAPVLERAVKGTGNRISAETLGQRLEVDAAKDADVLRIRVVDSTATGAAQLANAVPTAYGQLLGQQSRARSRDLVRQLRNLQSPLTARLAQIEVKLAGGRRPRFSGHSLRPSQPSCRRSNAGSGS